MSSKTAPLTMTATACPTSWKCPFDYETKKITAISLNNVRTRKVIKNLAEEVLHLCLEDANEKLDWIQCIKDVGRAQSTTQYFARKI
jgi:hypothetical protein